MRTTAVFRVDLPGGQESLCGVFLASPSHWTAGLFLRPTGPKVRQNPLSDATRLLW